MKIFKFFYFKASKLIGKGKSQIFRRKSELPQDISTTAAIDKYQKRAITSTFDHTAPKTWDKYQNTP